MHQQPRQFRFRLLNLMLLIVLAAVLTGVVVERWSRRERARAAEERALEDLRRFWDDKKAVGK